MRKGSGWGAEPVEGGVVGVELDGLRVERGGLEVVPRLELLVPLVLERRRRRNPFSGAARHRRRRQGVRGLGFWARELASLFSFSVSFPSQFLFLFPIL